MYFCFFSHWPQKRLIDPQNCPHGERTKWWLFHVNHLKSPFYRLHTCNSFLFYLFPPQTNNLQLCKPLIRAIESSSIRDKFSISQRVTYRYYTGRKAMFDNDFKLGMYSLFLQLHHTFITGAKRCEFVIYATLLCSNHISQLFFPDGIYDTDLRNYKFRLILGIF